MGVGVRRRFGAIAIILFGILLPHHVHAQVVINEVMYDPPGSDGTQEWIELFNAGSSQVDLTKWTFNDGSNTTKHVFNVPPKNGGIGPIAIQPGGYVIVADDAATFEAAYPSVPNVIDSTMSMPDPNAGVATTLTLYDDQKTAVDTLSYTGGTNADNKGDSVQRVSPAGPDSIVAAPTPGGANATVADTTSSSSSSDTSSDATSSDDTDTSQTSQTSQDTSAQTSSYVPPPAPSVFVDAGDDREVIVGADIEFDARAYDKDQNPVTLVRFLWNFGDGSTGDGESVLHHFAYPGRYAVVVDVAENKQAVSDEIIVTAEPAKLFFEVLSDGSVAIHNLAGRDLDLSDWIVKQQGAQLMLPPHSLILAGQTMRIPQPTLGFWANASAQLDYPNGVETLNAGQTSGGAATSTPQTPLPLAPPAPATASASAPAAKSADAPDEAPPDPVPPEDISSDPMPAPDLLIATSSQAAAAGAAASPSWLWWLAALALALVACGALVAARHFGKREWDIVEEKPE